MSEENDRGLCFHVEFGDFDMATCGDLNGYAGGGRADVETPVATAVGDVGVVKVNHHGSAYSSNPSFVATLKANVALISAGPNPYGHPTSTAIDRWRTSGSAVYLTGLAAHGLPASGHITVSSDGATGFAVQTTRSDAVFTSALDENTVAPARPVAQSRAIDDSCPAGVIGEDGFGDVLFDNAHESAIDCVVHWQVATGKTATSYAPAEAVSREQMASFIARLVQRSGGTLPAASRDFFGDDNSSFHQDNINRLAQAGVVGGKAPGCMTRGPGSAAPRWPRS